MAATTAATAPLPPAINGMQEVQMGGIIDGLSSIMGSSELYLLQGGNIAVAAVALMCFLFFLGIGGTVATKTVDQILNGYGYAYDPLAANYTGFST